MTLPRKPAPASPPAAPTWCRGRRTARRRRGRVAACRYGAPDGGDRRRYRGPAVGGNLTFGPGVIRSIFLTGGRVMPEIREGNDIVTQITTVKVPSQNQAEALRLMEE